MRDEEPFDLDDEMEDSTLADEAVRSGDEGERGASPSGGEYGAGESGVSVVDTSQASLGAPSTPPSEALGYEEARKMIMERHGVVIDKEDPLLIMVSLLDEQRKAIGKEQEEAVVKLRKVVEEAEKRLRASVEKTSEVILDEAVNSNLKNTLAKLASETQLVERLRHEMKKHRMWVGVLTSITVITTVMLFMSQL